MDEMRCGVLNNIKNRQSFYRVLRKILARFLPSFCRVGAAFFNRDDVFTPIPHPKKHQDHIESIYNSDS